MNATEGIIVADLAELLMVLATLKIARKTGLGGARSSRAVLTPTEGGMNVSLRGTGTLVLFRIGNLPNPVQVSAPDFVALLVGLQKLGDPTQPISIILHPNRIEFRGGALVVDLALR